MAVNGSTILLMVNIGTEALPQFVPVASQRDVTFGQTAELIDVSNKDKKARQVLSGRITRTVTASSLYVPSQRAYQLLKNFFDIGLPILIGREEYGRLIETARAYITDFSESAPDQGPAETSITLEIDGDWTAAT